MLPPSPAATDSIVDVVVRLGLSAGLQVHEPGFDLGICDTPTLWSAMRGSGGVSASLQSDVACKTTETMADMDTLWDAALAGVSTGSMSVPFEAAT